MNTHTMEYDFVYSLLLLIFFSLFLFFYRLVETNHADRPNIIQKAFVCTT